MRSILLALTLTPLVAGAQVVSSSLDIKVGGRTTLTLGPSSCDTVVQATWTTTVQGLACTPLVIWATAGDCGDSPGSGDLKLVDLTAATFPAQGTGTFTATVKNLPAYTAATPKTCGAANETVTHKLCGAFSVAADCNFGSKTVVKPAEPFKLTVDAVKPSAPNIEEVVPQDKALVVVFTDVDESATQLYVEVRAPGEVDFVRKGPFTSTQLRVRLEALENNVPYEVRALVEDEAGNVSDPSSASTGTPVDTAGFFEAYVAAGGSERGGCAAGPGAAMVWGAGLLLLGLAGKRVRR